MGADDGSGLALPATSREPFAGDAVQIIGETTDAEDGLRVLAFGPMTNLADALRRRPELVRRLETVYAMGGALFVSGNVAFGGPSDNKVAEWNIYVDPTAAQAVIDSGLTVRLVSLDGTNQVPVTPEYAERVRREATGPGALVVAELFAGHPFITDGTYSCGIRLPPPWRPTTRRGGHSAREPRLQVPALRLLALDGLEQGLEVADASSSGAGTRSALPPGERRRGGRSRRLPGR